VRVAVIAGENFERIAAFPLKKVQIISGVSVQAHGDFGKLFFRFGGRECSAGRHVGKLPAANLVVAL